MFNLTPKEMFWEVVGMICVGSVIVGAIWCLFLLGQLSSF